MRTLHLHLDPAGTWTIPDNAAIPSGECLILGFWSDLDDSAVRTHARSLRTLLPNALILGCSSSGVIHGRALRDATMTATLVVFERTRLSLTRGRRAEYPSSQALGADLARRLDPTELAHVLILTGGLNCNGAQLAKGLAQELPPGVRATGGMAGDGERFQRTTLLVGEDLVEGEAVCLGLHGEALRVGLSQGGGWEPFGMERTITASDGNLLMEIDGESALGLYERYLGKHAQNLPGSGHLFPLAVREPGASDWVTRTILGIDRDRQTLFFGGDVPEGSTVRLMRGTIDNLVNAATMAGAAARLDAGPGLALMVNCVGRRMLLKQFAEEEIETVADILGPDVALTGFYSYGEIAPCSDAVCCMHNQTMTLTVLHERL